VIDIGLGKMSYQMGVFRAINIKPFSLQTGADEGVHDWRNMI
jgi:hypothetical protein